MNYFSPISAAERYSKGRPYFHSNTVARIKEYLGINTKLNNGLDIACGTGLSSRALLLLSDKVYATDSSPAMIELAYTHQDIEYQVARATMQPFDNNMFDIITVCSGIHWFSIDDFLTEANRLLKSNSCLVLYDNYFLGEMLGQPEFNYWYYNLYLKKFPAPPRNDQYVWNKEKLETLKFNFIYKDSFINTVDFNLRQLILYLTTQSNIISKVESNETTYEDVEIWLSNQLESFFNDEDSVIQVNYGNWIKYLQKID